MKVTGFTFIRNAITYDYPIEEAIRSILPLCDEFVIAVGKSTDGTLAMIQMIDPAKIRIIETEWDDSLRTGGRVLAVETDKAYAAVSDDTDWCFYIQGDEIVHEKYLDTIRAGMERWKDDKNVDGLLFHYEHFYGSYDYVGTSTRWYPYEIRIVRKNNSIFSYRDAQGFRKGNDEKLNVKLLDAYIYHYGWVKDPRTMQRKQEIFHKLWHDDEWVEKNVVKAEAFDYTADIDAVKKFTGTHPAVMQDRISRSNWAFDYDISFNRMSLKERLKQFADKKLGLNFSYKNYRIV
ncbi:MAG: glycosyltransferase family 2 protein [Chitinophagaceae bacterium]|nr:glycosyltransferase family 2 protein [Chitinophagaceae bacterium]MCB9044834.1 glycosyltransferase family 2 protein [Chitinophagales bacterium]